MSVLRAAYLAFALWGAIYPFLGFGGWLTILSSAPAFNLVDFLQGAPRGVAEREILLAVLVLNIWALAETYVRKNWLALVALPVTWVFGIACGLPLYLFLRTAPPR